MARPGGVRGEPAGGCGPGDRAGLRRASRSGAGGPEPWGLLAPGGVQGAGMQVGGREPFAPPEHRML